MYRCPCSYWLCRTYLEFNLSYDCADPLVVLTLHMMLLLFCLGGLNHFPLPTPHSFTRHVCLSHALPLSLFASFDGRWTDTELAYMKLSSSLAIYQFPLPIAIGLPVWLADTLDSTHMSGHAWLCSAIFRLFLLYFILFYFPFLFSVFVRQSEFCLTNVG